ncbi:histidine kinase [Sphingobacterium sp. DN00404]|uniref:Histidine kinase n=1 Tax=Sphingobacterium micropteri TaxID=2763501 RepID=A0ABR7YJG6_9SPHI|nr:histidine kinase [Sphingobacterium micropteri]MBD1431422.1 histidine kinase [Sphingobacterium micropteri]
MKSRWIEFIIVTGIYLFLLITLLHDVSDEGQQAALQLHLFTVYGIVSFYLLYAYPILFSIQKMYKWAISVATIFFTGAFIHFVIQEWRPLPPHQIMPPFVLSGILCFGLLVYSVIKSVVQYLVKMSNRDTLFSKTLREFIITLIIGIAIFIPVFQVSEYVAALTAFAIPFSYSLFAVHHYYLLPRLDKDQTPKVIHIVLSIFVNLICIVLFSSLMEMTIKIFSNTRWFSFNGFNIFFCFLLGGILTPAIYVFYYHQHKQQRQIVGLQKTLGKTSADLKLLQSQINPHFLFNVMNTLYGIAIQENAERTSEGIQKLADIMRFMLHENQQDSILLVREIDYIKEYIAIQKLRIADIPSIQIAIELPRDDEIGDEQIAPMLLIPFIENAFKHGISLNKPSWIRVHLSIERDILKLSVYNSIHYHKESDPEKSKSGIGLENVRNRLRLLYPDRNKLHIEETNTEYFIFLTLNLT